MICICRYYAIELCRFSVASLFEGPKAKQNREIVINAGLSLIELLRQTTAGLDYLHSNGFIHRNIHPQNVLIAEIGGGDQSSRNHKTRYMVKLSDFRCITKLESQASVGNSLTQDEIRWIAPEMEDLKALLTTAADIFILGCFFYYVLFEGRHPFGSNPTVWRYNIFDINYIPDLTADRLVDGVDADGRRWERIIILIEKMITREPEKRPDLNRVLEYFQTRDYFPIYDGIKEGIRPGLCVIINQQIFQQVPLNILLLFI